MFAQLGMAATLLVASTNDNLTDPKTIGFLGLVLFLHNSFQTLQDVSTDAMAMDLLPPSERGRMNGFMWASKLVATSLGGIVLATVLVRWGLPLGVRIQAGLILAIMLLPLCIRERAGEKLFPWSPGRRMAPAGASVRVAGETVGLRGAARRTDARRCASSAARSACGPPRVALVVAFAMIVCEGFHDALTPAVFTQALGWTAEQYSRLQGGWGLLGRILGAIGGGFVCDRLGRRLTLGVASGISTLAFAIFGLTSAWWSSPSYPLALFIVVIQGSIAMTAVSAFSLFMKISWTAAAATQFTVYMAISNLGYAAGPMLTRLQLDDPSSYLAAAVVAAFLPIPFLFLLRPDSVVARKLAEESSLPELLVVQIVLLQELRPEILRRKVLVRPTLGREVHEVPIRPHRVHVIRGRFSSPEVKDVPVPSPEYVHHRPLHVVRVALAFVVGLIRRLEAGNQGDLRPSALLWPTH